MPAAANPLRAACLAQRCRMSLGAPLSRQRSTDAPLHHPRPHTLRSRIGHSVDPSATDNTHGALYMPVCRHLDSLQTCPAAGRCSSYRHPYCKRLRDLSDTRREGHRNTRFLAGPPSPQHCNSTSFSTCRCTLPPEFCPFSGLYHTRMSITHRVSLQLGTGGHSNRINWKPCSDRQGVAYGTSPLNSAGLQHFSFMFIAYH